MLRSLFIVVCKDKDYGSSLLFINWVNKFLRKLNQGLVLLQTLKLIKMKKYWILSTAAILVITGFVLNQFYPGIFDAGDFSKGYFAAGQFSIGVFAAGTFAIGIFSIGIFSIGVFSIGIFNIGIFGVGIFVYAWRKRKVAIEVKDYDEPEKV